MTQRDVTDSDGLTWACVQAYAGLGGGAAAEAAADHADIVTVVCTPTGAAQTVRLGLPADWSEALGDEALAAAMTAAPSVTSSMAACPASGTARNAHRPDSSAETWTTPRASVVASRCERTSIGRIVRLNRGRVHRAFRRVSGDQLPRPEHESARETSLAGALDAGRSGYAA